MSTLKEEVAELRTLVATLVAAQAQATSRPRKGTAKSTKVSMYRTKEQREAGEGWPCSCGRTNLRYPPKAGSYHNGPDGTRHDVA